MRTIDTVVIHYTATPDRREVEIDELRRWHVEERGWSDVGYHWVVHLDGRVSPGRPETLVGAHAKGHNLTSIGVCYVGGLKGGKSADTRTAPQRESLRRLVDSLQHRFGPGLAVLGHRDVGNTECPGFDVQSSDLVRETSEERPSLPEIDPDTLPRPVARLDPMDLPESAAQPAKALSARRIVWALEDEGFQPSEIRRIVDALGPLWELAADEVPYLRTARWAIAGLRDVWAELRAALRSWAPSERRTDEVPIPGEGGGRADNHMRIPRLHARDRAVGPP